MKGRVFFDTNILVYAYDDSEPEKQSVARSLLTDAIDKENGAISVQVLGEFFNVVTRHIPNPMSPENAWKIMATLSILPVQEIDFPMVGRAVAVHRSCQIAYWDALIVAAAERAGADIILSEALNDGQVYRNLRVRNPFKGS